ncbi:MAG: amidohydrolase family protein [Sphingobium sp.]
MANVDTVIEVARPAKAHPARTESYDLIIRGGMVVDGTGLPRRRVDIGIRDGRVARMAPLDHAKGREEIDATGLVVSPGIVDVHTHYDPQITFDPYATMSCYHGVTTVVAGNCGFSVAPCRKADRAALTDIFASVEDMDPAAMAAVRWDDFETFPEFLDSLKGRLGVNFACYVGHSNLRRWVMGDDCLTRTATPQEVAEMADLLAEAMEAGAAGLSSSHAPTHLDVHGRPVPSRLSDEAELSALVTVVGQHKSASITYLPKSAIGGMVQEDLDLLIRLSHKAGVPIIIQGIGGKTKVDVPTAGWDWASKYLTEATEVGAPVYSLLVTRPLNRSVPLGPDNKHYRSVFSWQAMLELPVEERRARLSDPAAREEMRFAVENYNRDPDLGTTLRPPAWDMVYVESAVLEKNRPWEGRSIQSIADDTGKAPGDIFLDLALEEDFATTLAWRTDSPEWVAIVREALLHPNMIAGTSDGGAHLAKDDGADWSSYFLRRWVIEEKLWTLEEGVRQITQIPAALMGLQDRGTLRVGGWADIMIFDPANIGLLRKEFTRDLPGNAGRWRSWAKGVKATIVNGQPIVLDNIITDRLPGHIVSPS